MSQSKETLRPKEGVSAAQIAVLRALWEHGELTLPQLATICYPDTGRKQYGTMENLLSELQRKGYVTQTRPGYTRFFRSSMDRAQFCLEQAGLLGEKLGDVSRSAFIMRALQAMTRSEQKRILRLLEELSGES